MRVKFSLEVTVRVDGEAMMSHQLMNRPLTVGHAKGSTLLLDTPIETLTLLPLLPGGFGLHLAPGLRGKVRVGSRTLEIQDGLIRDPRPEPLCFRDGDRGVLFLDEHVELRFTVRQQRRAFVAPWVPRDRQLLFSLGGSAIALLGLALAIVSTPPPPAQHHRTAVPLLKARPAIITRTFLKPRAPHPRKSPPRAGHGPGALASRRAVSKSHGQSRRLRQAHRHEATRSAHRTAQVVDRLLARLGSAPTLNIAPSPSKGPSSHPRSLRARQAHAHDALSALDRILPTATAMAQQTSLGTRHRLRLKPHRPRPHLTPAPAPHGLTRQAIQRIVEKNRSAIRGCYERELLRSRRPVEGTLLVAWHIDSSGHAQKVRIARDPVKRRRLNTCLLREIGRWRFPSCDQPKGCRVIFPFEFFARS